MKVSVGKRVLALMLVIPMVLATACGKKSEKSKDKELEKKTVDISECVSVSARGYDGMGTVSCQKDSAAINMILQDVMKEQYGEEVESETKNAYTKLEESIIFQAEPATGLSNGDEVTIKIVYDSKYAKTCGVKFSPSSFKYTVNGLDTVQMINAFEGLQVSFSGTEEATEVIVDNTKCSDFVRNFVIFSVLYQKEAYKNGESIEIFAEFGGNLPADYDGLYMLAETRRSYTVDGLDMYATSIDNLDVTEVVKMAYDMGNAATTNDVYNIYDDPGCWHAKKIGTDENLYCSGKATITDYSLTCDKLYYLQPKANMDNKSGVLLLLHLKYTITTTDGSTTDSIDSYVAAGCFDFVADSTQSTLKSFGEPVLILEDNLKEYTHHNHSCEQGYNAFVAPYANEYLLNELNPADYAEVMQQGA